MSLISIVVPCTGGASMISFLWFAPISILTAASEAVVDDVSVTFDTDAMAGIASPLNPSVDMSKSSSSDLILLVAWRSKQSVASSLSMPVPLSETLISFFPPCSTSTSIRIAPASMELSTSSRTTEAGRSMTSPAAILLIKRSGSTDILDIN